MAHPFITLYGINNLGKTTQAERLVAKLNSIGKPAVHLKYPRYDIQPSGPFINAILREGQTTSSQKEVEMWMAINRYQAEQPLIEQLEKTIVVSEDYTGGGIAWGVANGSPMEWMEQINGYLRKEDFAILLDGERFSGATEAGHIHETNEPLIQRCREVFQELARRYQWPIVSANGTMDSVQAAIWQLVNDHFKFE